MRVLFLCQRVPWPPDRGDRITTWHYLSHLLDRGDEVYLGCFREEPADDEAVARLAQRCRAVAAPRLRRPWRRLACLRGLLTGEPLTLPFFRHAELAGAVDRWYSQHRPDLVWVYSSSMAQYVLDRPGPVRLMQFAELDSDKWAQFAARSGPLGRAIYAREAARLLAFEAAVARAFDVAAVVSEAERELFTRAIPDVVPAVLQNGVDVDHFQSRGEVPRAPHTLIFTGVMDYAPNVDAVTWFADACLPRLRERFADARLLVVGSNPTARVLALAQRPGIEVTGRVLATPPYFDRSGVAIAPLRIARGVQNKVLEALSMALPVVCTSAAARGLGPVPESVRIADDADATVAAVAELFQDPARTRALGQAGAEWVRTHWRWPAMYERLDRLLAQHGLGDDRAAAARRG